MDNKNRQKLDKSKIYTSSVRTHISISKDELKTERQWAKLGYAALDENCGMQLWTNQYCQRKCRYLHNDEVRPATEEELSEYFRHERERVAENRKRKREQLRIEKERAEEKNKMRKIALGLSDNSINKADVIVIDTETTGLSSYYDEILQLSIIDSNGNTLYNQYFKPTHCSEWEQAQAVNGISSEMVKDCSSIDIEVAKINAIISNAKTIIGYNIYFDLGFLSSVGIDVSENTEIVDIMQSFAEIYGEWNDYYGDYKFQKLTTCASYYGYDWGNNNAHNSLADCYATLYCYQKLKKN